MGAMNGDGPGMPANGPKGATSGPAGVSGGWREYMAVTGEKQRLVRIEPEGDDLRMRIDGEEFVVSGSDGPAPGEMCLLLNGRPQVVHVRADSPGRYRVSLAGGEIAVELRDPLAARISRAAGSTIRHAREVTLRAPMPGVVVAIQAREGDEVAAEAPLVVLEAMKMQNALTSPIHGVVAKVKVTAGQTVEGDAVLVVLERLDSPRGDGGPVDPESGAAAGGAP